MRKPGLAMSRYARVIAAYDNAHPDPTGGRSGDLFRLNTRMSTILNYLGDGRWTVGAAGASVLSASRMVIWPSGPRLHGLKNLTVDEGELVEIRATRSAAGFGPLRSIVQ
ncbi:MAG: hypothetical protein R3D30_08170 [Hyphomicrobiales bacterium]